MAHTNGRPVLPTATHRAIVVGAGISGLTAAFRLRQKGFDVTVLASTDIVGGHIDRWDPGVAQTSAGWYKQVARFVERVNDTDRLQLAGDYMSVPSTNASALSGETAARRIAHAVSLQGTRTSASTVG